MSIMSVKEARKVLGEEYDKLSDDEIERIVNDLEIIASMTIKAIMNGEMKMNEVEKD